MLACAAFKVVLEFEKSAMAALAEVAVPGVPGIGKAAAGGGGSGGAAEDSDEEASSGGLQLAECFDFFSASEKLAPEDKW